MTRLVSIEDVPRVAEINVFGWRVAFQGILSDELLFKEIRVDKSIERMSKNINDPSFPMYLYEDNNKIIKGMMGFTNCRDQDKTNAYELVYIYVDPSFTNLGIGTEMLSRFEIEGKKLNFNEYCIWVLKKNIKAQAFYKKHGYDEDGVSKFSGFLKTDEIRLVKCI